MRSVKSGAAAISTRPARRSGRARATSSDSQPPMLDPTSTSLPVGELVDRRQRIVEPAADRAVLEAARRLAVTEIVEAQEGAAGLARPRLRAPSPWCRSCRNGSRPGTPPSARVPSVVRIGNGIAVGALQPLDSTHVAPPVLPARLPSTHYAKINAVSAPTLLQIVPTLAGGGLARATLDAAQAVIAAGGSAIVASPGGSHGARPAAAARHAISSCPTARMRLWGRLTLPGQARLEPARRQRRRRAGALARHRLDRARARPPARHQVDRHPAPAVRRRRSDGTLRRAPPGARRCGDRRVASMSRAMRCSASRRSQDRLETIPPGINFDRFDPAIVRADRLIRLAGELRVPDGSHLVLCPGALRRGQRPEDPDRGDQAAGPRRRVLPAARLDRHADAVRDANSNAPSRRPSCTAASRSAPMSTTCRPPTCWPTSWCRPAARRQGFSRTLVEAQAMGRPVVAEDGGGAAETLRARRHRLAGAGRRSARRWPRRCGARCRSRSSAAPNSRAPPRSMCAATTAWRRPTSSCSAPLSSRLGRAADLDCSGLCRGNYLRHHGPPVLHRSCRSRPPTELDSAGRAHSCRFPACSRRRFVSADELRSEFL